MRKHLRKLERKQLSKLAYETGVLLPHMTEKEMVEALTIWAASYSFNWSDFTSRFPWLKEVK